MWILVLKELIRWLVNDVVYHIVNPNTTTANGQPYPFNDEFYFAFALSVGGNLPSVKPTIQDFPDYLIIDYVRVYKAN